MAGVVIDVLAGKKGKGEASAADEDDSGFASDKRRAAEALVRAVHAKDSAAVADALDTFWSCSAMEDSEPAAEEEKEGGEYGGA